MDTGPKSKKPKGKKRWTFTNGIFGKKQLETQESFDEGFKENRTRKSQSSVDVRQMDDSTMSQGSNSKRRRFFGSFRKKFRSSKYRDQNENLTSLSTSQPNIFHSSSHNTSAEEDFNQHRSWINQYSVDKSISDLDTSPTRSRSQSVARTSSEEWDKMEADSGIAVIETTTPQEVPSREELIPRSYHGSVDYGESIPVDIAEEIQEPLLSNRSALLQNPFHELEVWLQEGCELAIRDSCGTSDPYVKFKLGNKQLYKSRTVTKNLNPKWDERFVISIEDPFRPVQVKVYDYDRGSSDDSMGSAEIRIEDLQPNVPTDLELQLKEKGKTEYMGYIKLQVTLVPKSQEDRNQKTLWEMTEYMGYIKLQVTLVSKSQEDRNQYFKRTVKLTDKESAARKLKMQMWTGVVTVVLVEGRDLIPMDDNGLSDPYVKFKLGNEKYRSKHKPKTLNPVWLEQFDLRMYQGQTSYLEIMLYDHDVGRDDFMGRAVIDLSKLEREQTHTVDQNLEDGAGIIKLLITISGTSGHESISDLSSYAFNPNERAEIIRGYGLKNSFKNMKDVGWLQVKVFKAQNLLAADLGGKSDPFCVLELVNTRLQTQTEYKTLNPEWNKLFTFNVKDIHSVLEVTVFDEDRDKKVEFLGKVAIPILRVKPGEKKWYALKDKKLLRRTKGSILLEFDFIYNHIKASIRTVNPKEEKYMQQEPKFKISVMKRNIDRVSQLISTFIDTGRFIQSCFNWDSPPRSIIAFAVFLVIVWNFEIYMLPITLLILLLKNLPVFLVIVWNFEIYMLPITLLILLLKNFRMNSVVGTAGKDVDEQEYEEDDDDLDDDDDREKEEKKSFKEKLHAAQEICLQVQEGLDVVASLGERVKNTFTWSVPWLTMLAVIVLSVASIILYYIPVRYLILAWGINKFTKKLRAPNAIPNNELLDFLSRVPSDSELMQYKELKLDSNTVPGRKKAK